MLPLLLLPPVGMEEYGIGEEEEAVDGEGPSDTIISMTLGRTM